MFDDRDISLSSESFAFALVFNVKSRALKTAQNSFSSQLTNETHRMRGKAILLVNYVVFFEES